MNKDNSTGDRGDFLEPLPRISNDSAAVPRPAIRASAEDTGAPAVATATEEGGAVVAPVSKRQQRRDKRNSKSGFTQWLKELPILLAIAFVLALLIKTFLVQAFFIPSGSMETTLHGCPGCAGDRILVNKMSYAFGDPEPGDIVVFKGEDDWAPEFSYDEPTNIFAKGWLWLERAVGAAPPDEKDFVKRVVATAGQTIQGDDQGRVLVDGKPLDEPYIYISPDAVGQGADVSTYKDAPFGPITVPKGRVFVMGDHRNGSADSRAHIGNEYFGTIAVDSVVGRAFVIVWPFSRFHWLGHEDIQALASGSAGLVSPPLLAAGVVLPISGLVRRRRRRLAPVRTRCAPAAQSADRARHRSDQAA